MCENKAKKDFYEIDNTVNDINKFLKPYLKNPEKTIISMENTGKWNWFLYEVLENMDFEVYVLHPYHLKKSLGLIREKK